MPKSKPGKGAVRKLALSSRSELSASASSERAEQARENTERDERVREAVRLISSGQWIHGVTEGELAEHWDIGEQAVRQIRRDAERVLRIGLTPEDRETIVASMVRQLEHITRSALANEYVYENKRGEKKSRPEPRYADAIAALKLKSELLSVRHASSKVEHTHQHTHQHAHLDFAAWSEAELEAYVNRGELPAGKLDALPSPIEAEPIELSEPEEDA